MSFSKTLNKLVTAFALVIGSVSAYAAAPGTDIDNTASVTYSSGGVPGSVSDDAPTIEVDRKIDLDVSWSGSNVTVIPGEVNGYLTYTVTNESNTNIAVSLAVENGSTNTSLTMTSPEIWVEAGGAGFDSGADTQYTSGVVSIPEGSSITVYVVADAPATGADGILDDFILVASADYYNDAGAASASSNAIAASDATSNGVATIETVFADEAGDGANDDDEDSEHSDTGTFELEAIASVEKTFSIDDGLDSGSDGFAIPGATVTYTITVSNAGAVVMTSINISDDIDTTNLSGPSNISIAADNCTASGLSAGGSTGCTGVTTSYAAPTLTVSGLEAAASDTAVVTFDVTIQ